MITKEKMIKLNYDHQKRMNEEHIANKQNKCIYKIGSNSCADLNDWYEEFASLGYHNLIAEIPKGGRCLEIGADWGRRFGLLRGYFNEVKGVEIYEPFVKIAEKKGNDIKLVCLEETGFSDSYFDVIIGSHVLEHTYDANKALRELKRILKPNGYLAMVTPHLSFPDTEPAHLTQLTKEEWIKKYKQFGFEIIIAHLHISPYGHGYECHIIARKTEFSTKYFGKYRRKIIKVQESTHSMILRKIIVLIRKICHF